MTTVPTAAPLRPAGRPPVPDAPGGPAEAVLVVRTIEEVPRELPPGLVVVLPGGFRMQSGHAPPPPAPPPPTPVDPPEAAPPDARATRARAAELTRLVAEVLAGRRAPAQLGGLAAPRVLRYLAAARAGAVARPAAAAGSRTAGRARAPGCGTARPAPRWSGRVHVTHPHADAAEVCVTLPIAGRPRALALRLDRRSGEAPWTVTAVRLL